MRVLGGEVFCEGIPMERVFCFCDWALWLYRTMGGMLNSSLHRDQLSR